MYFLLLYSSFVLSEDPHVPEVIEGFLVFNTNRLGGCSYFKLLIPLFLFGLLAPRQRIPLRASRMVFSFVEVGEWKEFIFLEAKFSSECLNKLLRSYLREEDGLVYSVLLDLPVELNHFLF
jgi:hypothetical protein